MKVKSTFYAYRISVKLYEDAILIRPIKVKGTPKSVKVIDVQTWEKDSIGVASVDKVSSVRDYVKDLVDQFCNGYWKANPKQ